MEVLRLWSSRNEQMQDGGRMFNSNTGIYLQSSGVHRNFFRGGSTNSVEDREDGDLGAKAP